MRKEEPSNNVRLAATNALLNSLEFTKSNFDKEVRTEVIYLQHQSYSSTVTLMMGQFRAMDVL